MKIKGKHFFFVGITGIGMSGIAKILFGRGYEVSGSGLDEAVLEELKNLGIKVFDKHDSKNINGADALVVTSAVKKDNPEIMEAKRLKIPIFRRSEILGEIMSEKKGIAVAGTHGKTTTSMLLSLVLEKAGLDPAIAIGGEVKNIGGNAKDGNSEYFIAEACEYEKAFLDLNPYAAIITNIEEDHLDTFKDLGDILETFSKFILQIDKEGFLLINGDDLNSSKIINKFNGETITFGIANENATWQAGKIRISEGITYFKVFKKGQEFADFSLKVPGIHNVMNALAVIASASKLGVKIGTMKEVLAEFEGVRRRFQIKGEKDGILVIDDYAHHPTEIRSTLSGLRSIYQDRRKKVWCVFQPHQYSRTRFLLNDFAQSFSDADQVIVPDIYRVRDSDEDVKSVNSKILVDRINKEYKEEKALYIADFEGVESYLAKKVKEGDILITMGAGPVYVIGEKFLKSEIMK